MDHRDIVYLIDPDSERRAAIAGCLDSRRYRIDPVRTVGELARAGSRSGIALVHDGAAAVRDLTAAMNDDASSTLRIVAFGEAADVPRVVAAVRDGAQDYLVWPFCGDALAAALDRTNQWDRPSGTQQSRKLRADARIERLTPRERQVLTSLAQGMSNRQMGQKLGISPRTVEIHPRQYDHQDRRAAHERGDPRRVRSCTGRLSTAQRKTPGREPGGRS